MRGLDAVPATTLGCSGLFLEPGRIVCRASYSPQDRSFPNRIVTATVTVNAHHSLITGSSWSVLDRRRTGAD